MPVGGEGAGVNEGLEDVVEQGNCGGLIRFGEEGLRAPDRQVAHELEVAAGLAESRADDSLHHFLILEVLLGKRPFSLLGLQLLELLVVLVGLVEAVGGVGHDHVEELLEQRGFEVLLQVLPVALMRPQRGENLVGVEPVLELLVELVGPARDGDAAVKLNEPVGQVLERDPVVSKDLMDQSCLVVVEEEEEQF